VLFNNADNYWCIASVVDKLMIMEHHCNDTDKGKPTSSEKYLSAASSTTNRRWTYLVLKSGLHVEKSGSNRPKNDTTLSKNCLCVINSRLNDKTFHAFETLLLILLHNTI